MKPGRLTLSLWGLMWILAAFDVALTWMGLSLVPGATEANPLPARAWDIGGLPNLISLKIVALVLVLALAALLEKSHQKWAHGALRTWCLILAAVNVLSVLQLHYAGVF